MIISSKQTVRLTNSNTYSPFFVQDLVGCSLMGILFNIPLIKRDEFLTYKFSTILLNACSDPVVVGFLYMNDDI